MDATTSALLRSLNSQRHHVLGALDGLGAQQLRGHLDAARELIDGQTWMVL